MNTIKKSKRLSNVSYDIRGSVVQKAHEMSNKGIDIINLNIGNPAPFGFSTSDEILSNIKLNLENSLGYSHSKGIISARESLAIYYTNKGFENICPEDIYIGNGVSELILMCMQGLVNPGDEILIPAPDYPLWTASVNFSGGKTVHYLCDESSEWNPNIEDMKSKITPNTKGIVLINPNNPTGAVYTKEILQEIVQIARAHNLIIFSDEIYEHLIMDNIDYTSIAVLAPDLFTITLSGLSKSHCVTGYRIGWAVFSGNKKIAKDYTEGIHTLASMRLCSNVPGQFVIPIALESYKKENQLIQKGSRVYEQRDYTYKALNEIHGISCVKPKAALYAFPKMDIKKFGINNDEEFALDLLVKKQVLIVKGTGFNWHTPDHFRIVYLPELEILKDAVGRMREYFCEL